MDSGTERGMLEHARDFLQFVQLFTARGMEYLACVEQLAKLMVAVARAAEADISNPLTEIVAL